MVSALMDTFGLSFAAAFTVAGAILFIGLVAVAWVFLSAPPQKVTVITGPEGSSFYRYATKYQAFLKKKGIEVRIVTSGGSLENLQQLQDPKSGVEVGFVQGGLTEGMRPKHLISLGSVAYQPVWIYYRNPTPIPLLSGLAGKRIAIGKVGSGTRAIAMTFLLANGVTTENATLVEDDAASAAKALIEGRLDAVFLMGEAAPSQTLKDLSSRSDVRLYDFTQAESYTRRYTYLNLIRIPQGLFDFAHNTPPQDLTLVGPTVDLVARDTINSALAQVLIDAAKEVHGTSGLLQKPGDFPALLEHEFTITDDVRSYYKNGKNILARRVNSIWLASVINGVLVAFVPVALLLIPVMRFLPIMYRLRIHLRIYRCYRPLLQLERDAMGSHSPERVRELLTRLDAIEREVDRLKVPASFGEQFYALRQHLNFVRERLLHQRSV